MKTVIKTHIGAYGILIRDGKIALIKKARGGYKGKYDLPGGGNYQGYITGIFEFEKASGYSWWDRTFRIVLTPTL